MHMQSPHEDKQNVNVGLKALWALVLSSHIVMTMVSGREAILHPTDWGQAAFLFSLELDLGKVADLSSVWAEALDGTLILLPDRVSRTKQGTVLCSLSRRAMLCFSPRIGLPQPRDGVTLLPSSGKDMFEFPYWADNDRIELGADGLLVPIQYMET